MRMVAAALAGLAGCAAGPEMPGPQAVSPAAVPVAVPVAGAAPLALPARVALVRRVEGRATPVPAAERTLWAGAMREVNALLPYPVRLIPVEAMGDAADTALARAFAAYDAVLVYDLAVEVEGDLAAATLSDLPIFGGIVPRTVSTEADGTASARLLDPFGAHMGATTAEMRDVPLGSIYRTRGEAPPMRPMAEHALLQALMPGVETMVVHAVAGAL